MQATQVITSPKVTLISRQSFILPDHFEGWETDAPSDAETLVEFAGRICYLSHRGVEGLEGGHGQSLGRVGNDRYLQNIITSAHGSVTEAAVWSFLIEGVSRSLTHELVRHRAGLSPSQLSQRYVDESAVAFVLPPEIEEDSPSYHIWESANLTSLEHYRALLRELDEKLQSAGENSKTLRTKRARQAARSVLPNCTETKLVLTGNARAWRHVAEMRGSEHADLEIRRLAVELARQLKEEAPNLFYDVSIVDLPDGTQGVQVENSKI